MKLSLFYQWVTSAEKKKQINKKKPNENDDCDDKGGNDEYDEIDDELIINLRSCKP